MTPVTLPVEDGFLFLTVYASEHASGTRGYIVHLPAFAEEMNRSRHMISQQARELAAAGFTVVVVDLAGTGDSSGEFADTDWSRWRQDSLAVLHWLQALGANEVSLWGLRLGALLALDVARTSPLPIRHLLLWQPVTSGERHIHQFLRQRTFSETGDGAAATPSALKERLQGGELVEVAGYSLSRALVDQIADLAIDSLEVPEGTAVTWMEVRAQAGQELRGEGAQIVAGWIEAGVEPRVDIKTGPSFWATQETTLAPELLTATAAACELAAASEPAVPAIDFRALQVCEGGERPVTFSCEGEELLGVLHPGDDGAEAAVLILVGGPQYRVGAHRQFAHVARALAGAGIPALRFDFRGMGDSSGQWQGFEATKVDTLAAIDTLQRELPSVKHVLLWGLCDGATAACLFADADRRIAGLALANPWVFSSQGYARAYLKHYYPRRLASAQFWRELFAGRLNLRESFSSFVEALKQTQSKPGDGVVHLPPGVELTDAVAMRVRDKLAAFDGPVLLLLSENDLTAAEFRETVDKDRQFREVFADPRIHRCEIAGADHTFSRHLWREQVGTATLDWVKSVGGQPRRALPDAMPTQTAPAATVRPVAAPEPAAEKGVVSYSAQIDPYMMDFQARAWPDRNYQCEWPYWRWVLLDSAERLQVDPRAWLYFDDGKIVGEQGAVPVRLKVAGDQRGAEWFIDTMVLDEYQERPVGPQLFLHASRGGELPLSLGQTEYMKKLLLAGGWQDIGILQRYVYPLNAFSVLEGKVSNPVARWFAGKLISAGVMARRIRLRRASSSAISVQEVDSFGPKFDELWEAASKQLGCAVVRDASYLNWRYAGRHERRYKRLAVWRGSELLAAAIVAISPPSSTYPHRRAFIVDLVLRSMDDATLRAALDPAIDFAREHEADALHFYLCNPPLGKMLGRLGFIERPGTHCLLAGTRRLPKEQAAYIGEYANWYCTMGDSDVEPSALGHE